MSEETGKGDSLASGDPEGVPVAPPSDGASRNWEERLAAARLEREKALKAKGKPLKKRTMPRPDFMDNDPAANWALEEVPPEAQSLDEGNGIREPGAYETLASEPAGEPSDIAATPEPPRQASFRGSSVSVSWVVIVAFACFFGLGAGMVLSFGAVVAMGWVSLGDVAPKQVAEQSSVSPNPPQAQVVVFKPLSPIVTGADTSGWTSAGLTPVAASIPQPVLATSAEPDQAPARMASPAPRIDAAGIENAPVSRFDFQPANIAVSFALPQQVAARPSGLEPRTRGQDVPPDLLEKSGIRPLTVLAGLSLPNIGHAAVDFSMVDAFLPRRTAKPTLPESVPGVVPEIALVRLARPDVLTSGINPMSAALPAEIDGLVRASLSDSPPARALPSRTPAIRNDLSQLPQVGAPHDYTPSLAYSMGLAPEDIAEIRVVTFAPGNVSDARIAENAAVLGETGFETSKVNRVNFKVSRTHIRYYRPQDATIARALAEQLGGTARDFTRSRQRQPDGQIEVWLQGNRKGTRSTAPRQSVSATQRREALKAQLEKRLVNSLRRGDHLSGPSQ